MQERRRIARWQFNRPAQLRLAGCGDFCDCRILDINFKGMKIALSREIKKDEAQEVEVSFDTERPPLQAQAWVSWHRQVGAQNIYGLSFTRIKDIDKEKIYTVLHQESRQQLVEKWWENTEKGGKEMEDRRIFARIPVDFPARLLNSGTGEETQGRAFDISANGVGLEGNTAPDPHAALEVWVDIPDQKEPFYARGKVVWSRPLADKRGYRTGVCLEKSDLMSVSRILRLQRGEG